MAKPEKTGITNVLDLFKNQQVNTHPVICEKNMIRKIRKWWRGEFIPTSLSEILGETPPTERFKKPAIRIALESIWKFWLARWVVILPVIAVLVIGVMTNTTNLFIYFHKQTQEVPAHESKAPPENENAKISQTELSKFKGNSHSQPTSLQKVKQAPTKIKAAKETPQEPASQIYARQQVERWRKEIQSFANGGSFNTQEFLKSSTYTEMYPFLTSEALGELSNKVVTITVGRPTIEVQNKVLMALYADLDRISAK